MNLDAIRTRLTWMTHPKFFTGIVMVIGLLIPSISSAQSSSMPEGIVARGNASITVEPAKLRLTMSLQAQGKDAKSAVRSLAAHKERVRKELGEMNADTDSIEFSSTQLSSGGNDDSEQVQYMQMMRMMRRQMGQSAPDMDSIPTIYTATTSLVADWPLPTKDADALSLLPQGLLLQVNQRDFKGEKNNADLDEESLEKIQETQEMMEESYGYSMDGSSNSGPKILFVGKVSDEQKRKAINSAIEKAKKSAQLSADTLGVKLGELKTFWPSEETNSYTSSMYSDYMDSDMFMSDTDSDSSEDVVTAKAIDDLGYQIRVFMVYGFE